MECRFIHVQRAQLPARDSGLHSLDGVGQHDRHVVADAHTALGIGVDQPVRRGVEFAARDGAPVATDRRLIGSECGQRRNRAPIGGTGSLITVLALEDAARVVDQHGVQLLVGDTALLERRDYVVVDMQVVPIGSGHPQQLLGQRVQIAVGVV
jgi:hypothetical protein